MSDRPIVPQPGEFVVVNGEEKPIAIATVGDRQSSDPPSFDVTLIDGCRAVALWTPTEPNRGFWHAIGKGPSPAS